MIAEFAEALYTKSIQLKKFNRRNLLLQKNRLALTGDLKAMQELVSSILSLLNADKTSSPAHFELALFMQQTLFECVCILSAKEKNYRETVCRHTWGFHNLPRAFLPEGHPFRTSAEKSLEYFKSYLNRE